MPSDPPIDALDACDGTEMLRVRKGNRWRWLPVSAIIDFAFQRQAARDAAQDAALAAIAGRPEEAAHFAASAKLPAVTLATSTMLTLKNLVPARAGDVLKAGESVTIAPLAPLPAGLVIAAATVPADNIVALQLAATVAIAAGTSPTAWAITALR